MSPSRGRRDGAALPLHRRAGRRHRAALAGPLGGATAPSTRRTRSGRGRRRARRTSSTCWTCSRTRPAPGCTSGTRWASSAPTCWAATCRMTGRNVLHTMGFDAFGLPAEQYAVQTGTHPRKTTEANIAALPAQLRQLGLAHDQRRSVATTDLDVLPLDAVDLPADLQLLVRREAGQARPIAELEAEFAAGQARHSGRPRLVRADARRAARVIDSHRLAYLSEAPVNWCPGPGHGAGQRGGHRRRPQRARQLPRVPPQPAPVDDADHRLRRPPGRRPGPAGLAGLGQGHAAQLDRPLARARRSGSRSADDARSRSSPPARTPCSAPPTWCWRPSTRWSTQIVAGAVARRAPTSAGPAAPPPRPRRSPPTARRPRASPSWTARRTRTRPASSPAPSPPTRSTAQAIPVFVADYVLMGYGTGAIMAVPGQDQRDWDFATVFGLPIIRTVAADRGLRRRGVHRRRARRSTRERRDQPGRPGRRRGQEGDHRLAGGSTAHGEGRRAVQAARLAVLPAALLGRAVPDRLGRATARSPLPDDQLPVELPEIDDYSPKHLRPGRRRHRAGAAAVPRDRVGRRRAGPGRRAEDATAARPTRCRSGPARAGTTCATWTRTTTSGSSTPRSSAYWLGPRPGGRPGDPGGVDLYVGGVEHAVLHLLYARFWHKVLFDLGHVSARRSRSAGCSTRATSRPTPTPTRAACYVPAEEVVESATAGFTWNGEPVRQEYGKMGKSLKNVVTPDEMCERYGADTFRLYEMSTGPDGRLPAVVDPGRRRLAAVPAAGVAQPGRRADRRAAGHRRRAGRGDAARAAQGDRRRARRLRGAALQHGRREADRAEQPPDQDLRRQPVAARGGRAAGADAGAAVPRTSPRSCGRGWATTARWPTARSRWPTSATWSRTRSSTRSRSTARSARGSPCRPTADQDEVKAAALADEKDRRAGRRRRAAQGDRGPRPPGERRPVAELSTTPQPVHRTPPTTALVTPDQ